ncbi:TPA: sulfatase family protein [Klebsiella pneumoniae]
MSKNHLFPMNVISDKKLKSSIISHKNGRNNALQRARKYTGVALLALSVSMGASSTTFAEPSSVQEQKNISAEKKMNMVFVLVDDLRYDMMGFINKDLKTPNIDYLAKNGVYFPNAVVTSSLCSPSRATILTGQTVRNHGIVDNNDSSEKGLVFFPSYLQKAGYQTAFIGKWHMGFNMDDPRPGFNKWISFKGQGTYFPTDRLSPEEIAAGKRQMLNVDGKHVEQKGYITDELTDYALTWLEKERDQNKPFFLYLSHKAVHSDAVPAPRHKNQYADLDIKLPASMANTPENNAGKPMWVQNARNSWQGADFPFATDMSIKKHVRDIYQTLSSVDDSVGRILDYLRRTNHLDDTMIVFYSDNGYLIGDHGMIDKRNAYEPSVRVPMVVYAPALLPKGEENKAVVRNLDLAPTFLDLAGIKEPSQMEGESWLALAEGKVKPADWNPGDFVYEYYWDWTLPHTPTTFAIERNRVKYIQYHGIWDTEEIYDLNKDPNEMHNLINDKKYFETKLILRKALFEQLANNAGKHDIPYTEKKGPGILNRDVNGTHAADFPKEWYVKPNLPTKLNNMFPDSKRKLEAEESGKRYIPR